MVIQYPYYLHVLQRMESVQDANLDFVNVDPKWLKVCKCRDEHNSNSGTTQTIDGNTYNYSYLIQLPKSCPHLKIGDKIKVTDSDGCLRVEGIIQLFKRDQMHCRLWV